MDWMNEIGKKTSQVCQDTVNKTSKLAKEAKQKMKMAGYKSQIEDLYEEIGRKVYENHIREEKQDLLELTLEECVEIDKLASQIEETRKIILALREKKQCPQCFMEIAASYRFCPNCGTLQQEEVETNLPQEQSVEKILEGLEPISIPKNEKEKEEEQNHEEQE